VAFGDSDLGVFFADMGIPVSFGGVTVLGNFDQPAMGINFGGGPSSVERQQFAVTVPLGSFSRLLRSGDTVTVDGATYKVKGRELSLDGSIVAYSLEKP
jgi:hypothetical protein